MKVSLNWLKDYVDLKGISNKEIISKLTFAGLEVEDYYDENEIYNGFIVACVKEKKKHPNADRLSLCKVFNGKNDLQVICGAPNVDAGQKVIFAPIGTRIPKGGFKIGKAKIRGIESNGMICSEDELEFGDNHDGIVILDDKYKAGTKITKALGLNDVIFEIGITPNRPDALSHIGVARDIAAIFNLKLNIPKIKLVESKEKSKSAATIKIEDSENCPRYSSRIIKNINIKESPEWLKQRLVKIGLRPRNNIVDITNYVMHECGQPLHAFDLDNLAKQEIIIKSTTSESKFTTLDSKERKMPEGSLMICDGEKPVAVAGVMGGENSEITETTKNILIESAYFNPSSIRKTAKALTLSTDASYRFERGTDPGNTVFAAERAAQLILELAGGELLAGAIDEYPNKIKNLKLKLRFNQIERILGYSIPKASVKSILKKLGFKVDAELKESIKLTVPTFRPDIEREIDLIEEIARIYGYDNIPTVSKVSISLGEKTDESSLADKIRFAANSLGFYEMINNPLQSESYSMLTGIPVKLMNPLSLDMEYLRTSLLPGALSVVSNNIKYGEKNLFLFEIGKIFNKSGKNEIKSFEDFEETQKLIFVVTGNIFEKKWNREQVESDLFTLKGLLKSFERKILLDNVLNDSYYHGKNSFFDLYFTKNLGNKQIGKGGRVAKEVLKQFDIQQDVFCFEIDLDEFSKIKIKDRMFSEPLKFPKVIRDFAFIFDKSIAFDEVQKYIKKEGSELLRSVEIFDLFESDTLGNNKKSMAFTLEYYSDERTLTEEEVEKEFSRLISVIIKNFDAKLRGN
ncbi:MAG TPA: phenylalanine--tRNA ligase subunit beta [Ignavibacteriaceae bacterium]|nr:phenylalanine--tRNA ligase subunit beta [Ignavibacteriaceae bacterium]